MGFLVNLLTRRSTCMCHTCSWNFQMFFLFIHLPKICLINLLDFPQCYKSKCLVKCERFAQFLCLLPVLRGSIVTQARTRDWSTVVGLVYSAVGLPGSKGNRGCVQGLINHDHFGRDKQAAPSRDAAVR